MNRIRDLFKKTVCAIAIASTLAISDCKKNEVTQQPPISKSDSPTLKKPYINPNIKFQQRGHYHFSLELCEDGYCSDLWHYPEYIELVYSESPGEIVSIIDKDYGEDNGIEKICIRYNYYYNDGSLELGPGKCWDLKISNNEFSKEEINHFNLKFYDILSKLQYEHFLKKQKEQFNKWINQ